MKNLAPFEDARLLHARAQVHISEFNDLCSELWSIRLLGGHKFKYALFLDRAKLKLLKPIVGDVANNIVHSLDQVTAVFARRIDSKRDRTLYFPKEVKDEGFEKHLASIKDKIGVEAGEILRKVRYENKPLLRHLDMMVKISNSSKHWGLTLTDTSALAVAFEKSGQSQKIVQIPMNHFHDHDHFVFWDSAQALQTKAMQTVIQFRFVGLEVDGLCEPATHMAHAALYAEKMIGAAEKFLDQTS